MTTDERIELKPSEAANRLGCSVASVIKWVDSGKLAGRRTPLGRLVDAQDVERLRKERNGR